MKKLLGIVVLCLLFISINLSNPTRVEAGWFDDINPVKYFEKRKECKEDAEVKVRILNLPKLEKEYYKECMED